RTGDRAASDKARLTTSFVFSTAPRAKEKSRVTSIERPAIPVLHATGRDANESSPIAGLGSNHRHIFDESGRDAFHGEAEKSRVRACDLISSKPEIARANVPRHAAGRERVA